MNKKKLLLILGTCAVVLAIVLIVLQPEQGNGQTITGAVASSTSGSQTTEPLLRETEPGNKMPGETDADETAPTEAEPGQSQPDDSDPWEPESEPTEPEQSRPVYTEPEQTEPPTYDTVAFPLELEGGRLTVQSLFQFSGMNPDMGNAEGENIAGLQITNTSDEHLRNAEITAVLADGTGLNFRIQDLPAGMSAMVFALDNEPVANVEACEDLYGWAEFEAADACRADLVEITTNGMEITVRNVSGGPLKNLNVYCHSMLDGSCFGGVTYCYTIDSLSAGQSAAVFAWECILGQAQVVRVELGD